MEAAKKEQARCFGGRSAHFWAGLACLMHRVLRDTSAFLGAFLVLYHGAFLNPVRAASPEQAKREYFEFLFKNPSASVEQRKSAFEKLRTEGVDADLQQRQRKFVESRINRKKARQKKGSLFSLGSEVKASPGPGSAPGRKAEVGAARGGSPSSGKDGATLDTSTMPDVLDFTKRPSPIPPSPSTE